MFPNTIALFKKLNLGKTYHLQVRPSKTSGTGTIVVYSHIQGVTKRVALGLKLLEDPKRPERDPIIHAAIHQRDQLEVKLNSGEWSPVKEAAQQQRTELFDSIETWIESYYTVQSTKNSARHALKQFKVFYKNRKVYLEDVTRDEIFQFKKWLLERKTQNHARLLLQRIATFFNNAETSDKIGKSPARGVSIAKVEKTITFLSEEDLTRVLNVEYEEIANWLKNTQVFDGDAKKGAYLRSLPRATFDEVIKAYTFSCYTGLRISDIRALNLSLIRDDEIHFVMKKTKLSHSLPLSDVCKKIVKHQSSKSHIKGPQSQLFDLPKSTNVSWILDAIKTYFKLEIPLDFRLARRSFATWLVRQGVDIYVASKLLGHASIKMTEKHYARVETKVTRSAIQKLPNLINA